MTVSAACSIANESLFCEARALMKKLEDELVASDAMHMTHDQIERMVVTEGHKILRAMLQQHYDLRAAEAPRAALSSMERLRAALLDLIIGVRGPRRCVTLAEIAPQGAFESRRAAMLVHSSPSQCRDYMPMSQIRDQHTSMTLALSETRCASA